MFVELLAADALGGGAKSAGTGSGVDWANYGKRTQSEIEDNASYKAAGGYGLDPNLMNRPGMTTGSAASYLDHTESDAFRKRLDGDLASLGSRTARTANATDIGPGGRMTPSALGSTSTYYGSQLNLKDDAAARAQQARAIDMMRARANGTATAPGVDQLNAGLNSSLAAMTAARAGRPGNAGLAARGLGTQKAAAMQGAAGDAVILKAQDQQASQAALANMLTASRSADMAGAQTNAGLRQNANMFNADAMNKAAMATAGGQQNASMFNAGMAQEQYSMDQQAALQNMEAYLRNQGLNDAAIASRMSMYANSINTDKKDDMSFWGYAAGNRKFDSTMDYQANSEEAMRNYQQMASLGSMAGSTAGFIGSMPSSQASSNSGASYGEDGKRKMVVTSDRNAKTTVRPASSVLRAWMDELGGSR